MQVLALCRKAGPVGLDHVAVDGTKIKASAAEAARPSPPIKPRRQHQATTGQSPKHEPGKPKPRTQRNFIDPESRIMKGRDGFIQTYNTQAVVDADAQIIVAHRLNNNGADRCGAGQYR